MQNRLGVDAWVSMFREIGLNEEQMKSWHKIFESRHPEAHQSFLDWLGLSAGEIAEIRTRSK